MVRLVIAIVLGGIIYLVLPYLYVPSTIRKSVMALVPVTQKVAQPFLLDKGKWGAWWPGGAASASGDGYLYNGRSFTARHIYLTGADVLIDHEGDTSSCMLSMIPFGTDSIKITWDYQLQTSLNPIKRRRQQGDAKSLQADMTNVLQQMASFLSDEQNIYHIQVTRSTITDTLLVMTRQTLNQEPTQATIYGLIHQLQQYINKAGAQAINPPMLHVRKTDSSQVEVMVALPVNKVVNSAGAFAFKRMVPGHVLVTEITGGAGTVRNSFQQLEKYAVDHRLESPAIPFESLVTDRIQQPDSSKWITKIYYPVF
jgi:effector-binding domain-containing protein